MTDAQLKHFLVLKETHAKIEAELKQITTQLKELGSFDTDEFSVKVSEVTMNRVISADELCVVLDPVLVAEKNLIRTSTFEKVTVKHKALKVA
jgi:hypothetical protein